MHSVFFTAIELTCLIESISTNNPRIEWKKIKNGVPSYVYFQNKIAGKPLANSLFFKKADQPVRPQRFKVMSQYSKLSWMNGTLKELGIEFCFSVKSHCVYEWAIVKWFFFSLKRGLGAQSSAQRAGQHPDLEHHSVRHCRVPLRGGRHWWSKGLWWDSY